jgi:hypothetical protein
MSPKHQTAACYKGQENSRNTQHPPYGTADFIGREDRENSEDGANREDDGSNPEISHGYAAKPCGDGDGGLNRLNKCLPFIAQGHMPIMTGLPVRRQRLVVLHRI